MKHFFNSADTLVSDAIDGLILGSGGRLARLDGYPEIKVVVRTDRPADRVAVISGGGSGHEPAHAGFVGEGLLDAAVCGEVFASPTVDAVLAAILAVTGPAGCLLIVKNYGGDRLNFGLAAERARALGLDVEMVIVGDDIALPDNPRPRGIAGTVFVHKAAGFAAAAGLPLAEVTRRAKDAAGAVKSLGVATATCSIPGRPAEARMEDGHAELGLGIHGEPGLERIVLPGAARLVADMIGRFGADVREAPRLALLLNNLGGAPALELSIVLREILLSPVGPRIELVLGPAGAVTALDMRGFSISLMPLDDSRHAWLTAPVAVPAWPAARTPGAITVIEPSRRLQARVVAASADPAARKLIRTICDTLIAAQHDLDALDARVGDGDTGSTFAAAARKVGADLDLLPLADPAALCEAVAERLSRVMGGSSGVLLSIFAAAAGVALKRGDSVAMALRAGAGRMQHYGGAAPGDRTMIDALLPAVRALADGAGLAAAALAARAGANATAAMTSARAGRSSYLSAADLAGVVDPGAEAVARVMEALAKRSTAPS
ncbi:dihydroxyacetone kinase subunit DhaK [Xanthobacter dioxanivorans]|uniref:Dihydroxyacetone kinase subunit DhaK n=1 Tax=Xanthobacter dioxanivorans TaxID=2528964 RepID=A0A974SIL6_9HYPH|nr:dihydroxyacetone kinase subunit DhaK [Xanthobacter dioxanivorans]QRG06562.1 dihydroxyacetone kinase subunit DhaK [Xanthobacter dioxanivorans]